MLLKTVDYLLEIKASDISKNGVFEGYGSVFHNVDQQNDVVVPGAFTKSLQKFAEENRAPPMFWHHDPKVLIGNWLAIGEDSHGLKVKGQLWIDDPSVPQAIMAWRAMRDGGGIGASVGFIPRDMRPGPRARNILDVELVEISLTAVPANKQATVSVAKALETLTDRDFADILCDRLGLPADLALEIARSGWPRKAVSDLDMQNTDAIAQAIGQAFAWLEEDVRK